MNQTLEQYKRHQLAIQRRALKATLRRKRWILKKNQRKIGKNKRQKLYDQNVREAEHIYAPKVFSIKRNPNEVFKFIKKIKSIKYSSKVSSLHISLVLCTYISNGAIALMISAINEIKVKGIRVSGDYPLDLKSRLVLEQSGFFKFVIGDVSEENLISLNTITQQGLNVVDSEVTALLVTKAMKTVWGQPFRNQRLQGMLIELMANSVNHAFNIDVDKRWYLSISHNEVNKTVFFTFIDNGYGIINTLNIKFVDKIKALIQQGNQDIIKAAFQGEFGSRTHLQRRGKGLPYIKKCFIENQIQNLVVITNNVYLNFKKDISYKLNVDFDGTCYYWELNTNCTPWNNL